MDPIIAFHTIIIGLLAGGHFAHIGLIEKLKKDVKDLQEKVKKL